MTLPLRVQVSALVLVPQYLNDSRAMAERIDHINIAVRQVASSSHMFAPGLVILLFFDMFEMMAL